MYINDNTKYVELNERVKQSYMAYAIASIVDKALPDVRDGCLPIYRRILFAMKNKGLTYDKELSKSPEAVSETLKIHNHGDSSAYDSLALLTDKNESLLHPYIEGGGSFGKVYSTKPPAHMRYTFCRLLEFAEEMFDGLSENAVKFIGKEHKQPIVLPNTFPNILIKPNSAIAVGVACNWGSFNLKDVCKLTYDYIDNKSIEVVDYLTPDFSTGGQLIYNKNDLIKIYNTGRGSIRLRSKYRYDKEENIIEIYEIPYNTTVQSIEKDIKSKLNKFKEIVDVRNESGFNKERQKEELLLAIQVRKNTNIDLLMSKLFKQTSLESSFSFNMNCLVNNQPKTLGIKQILDEWIKFREECIYNKLKFQLNKKEALLKQQLALKKVLLDIDKTINIIRYSENPVKELNAYFSIDDEQSLNILKIELRNINKDYIIKKIKNIDSLEQEVIEIRNNINNIDYIHTIIKNQLKNVSEKYGKPRKTEIIYEDNIKNIKQEDLIEDFTTTLVLTNQQYFKKCQKYSENQNTKDGDFVKTIIQDSNKSKVLFFSNQGNIYIKNIWELQENKPSALGQYLPNLLPLETDETIIGMISTNNYKGNSIIIYPDGHIALIDLKKGYYTKQNSTRLKNGLAKKMDLPIYIGQITDDVNIELTDVFGKTKIISTKDINRKDSRSSQGVTAWSSKKQGWELISAKIIKIN